MLLASSFVCFLHFIPWSRLRKKQMHRIHLLCQLESHQQLYFSLQAEKMEMSPVPGAEWPEFNLKMFWL